MISMDAEEDEKPGSARCRCAKPESEMMHSEQRERMQGL